MAKRANDGWGHSQGGISPRIPARRARLLLVGIFALALVAGNIQASTPPHDDLSFRRWVLPEYVPSQVVTALTEDDLGFLWIGTQNGLVRFDGYDYRYFAAGPAPEGLGGAYVRALLATPDGLLWIGTFSGGLSVYDPRQESFRHFRHDPADPTSLAHDRVEGLAVDHQGHLWVATSGGLCRVQVDGERLGASVRFEKLPVGPGTAGEERVRGLLVDREGRLWVGTAAGLFRQRSAGPAGSPGAASPTTSFERIRPDDPWLARQTIIRLSQDQRGRIWIGTSESGAALFDPANGFWKQWWPAPPTPAGVADPRVIPGHLAPRGDRLDHFWISGLTQVGDREMWLATFGGGIDIVDLERLEVVARLRHDPLNGQSLGGDRIGALWRDRSGAVWVGSWGQGVARHDPQSRAWRALRLSSRGLSHPAAVRALATREGTFWVGTNGNGIDLFDRELRRIGGWRATGAPTDLADGAITCLGQAPDGAIWVATLSGALHRFEGGGFRRWTQQDGLAGGQIRTLAFGPDGVVWAGSSNGLTRLEPPPGTTRPGARPRIYRRQAGDPQSLAGTAVEALALDGQGRLWIGTENGLDVLELASDRLRHLQGRRGAGGLPNHWVRDLLLARDGRLWVATEDGAARLRDFDGETAFFEELAPRLGRPAGPVDALIEDAAGWLWLGPNLRIDPGTWDQPRLVFQTFGPADGCELRGFFIASRERLADGRLAFGSPEGLQLVDPAQLTAWSYLPPVVASRLRIAGESVAGASRREKILLGPGQRGFTVEFAALDFSAPSLLRYRHRLEPYEPDWQQDDASQRSATYTNLPPGAYTLRVQGSNRAGLFGGEGEELRLVVEVAPAFYQKPAFHLLVLVAAAFAVHGLFRWRLRTLEQRSQRLEALVRERTASLEQRGRELELAYRRLEEASLTDPLTGLRNRRFVDQTIQPDLELILRRHRPEAESAVLAFLIVDLDHFKSVNDLHGHAAGDAVLVQVAQRLRAEVRAADTLVRWGGEEFLIIARLIPRGDVPKLAEKIRCAIASRPFRLPDGQELVRTLSLGFAVFPPCAALPEAIGWERVVHLADFALYAAKHRGRNRWCGIDEIADPTAIQEGLENLEQALREGRLSLVESASP